MVRFPLGGVQSWVLQYLVGLARLGHDVHYVEKSPFPGSCYDPAVDAMTDDCSRGVTDADALLRRFGLANRWAYVDSAGRWHGRPRRLVEQVLGSADLFVEMGSYGDWLTEAAGAAMRVYVDTEPGFTQMLMHERVGSGAVQADYDRYYTDGVNIATGASTAPTAGRTWHALTSPVVTGLFAAGSPPGDAFTTVMSWGSQRRQAFGGVVYGQKDLEFGRFLDLPMLASAPMEVAVSGRDAPVGRLRAAGWRVRDANDISRSVDSYWRYIAGSRGEFSVCKNVFVATNCGWFSDRSAVYLASGRPVVLQDSGYSAYLPCGKGLFAVGSAGEAAEAIDRIEADYEMHARGARAVAEEFLDARVVLGRFLRELGA